MIDEHRRLRELLGARALGDLPSDERAVLDAHLETCASCQADLTHIQPVVEHLRRAEPDAAPGRTALSADLPA